MAKKKIKAAMARPKTEGTSDWLSTQRLQWHEEREKSLAMQRAKADREAEATREAMQATREAILAQAAGGKPPGDTQATAVGRGVAPRDEWCLVQYEARGYVTFHKPSKVCAKWNAMKLSERQAICPDRPETALPYAIDKGIKRARIARDVKPGKPPAKRKRTARKA